MSLESDESFLDYCAIHSRTELALFHADHVQRLADLAGVAIATSGKGWWTLRAESADPLIEMAREKICRARTAARNELLAAGFVEGALEA